MKLYLAGPMTGIENFNFPAFHEAAAVLRDKGHDVVNPADNFDGDQSRPWAEYLSKAVVQVADCAGIVLLPGWEGSTGVELELAVARKHHLAIFEYDPESRHDGVRPWYAPLDPPDEPENVLQEAERLIYGDRQATYGHPASDFQAMGRIAGAILHRWLQSKRMVVVQNVGEAGVEEREDVEYFPDVDPRIVALLMTAVKLSREAGQHKRDNLVDLAGYAGCAQRCVEHEEGAA